MFKQEPHELTSAEVRTRFKKLLQVTEALTAEVDFESLLTLIVHSASQLLTAERATLYLYDATRHELWSKIAEGISKKEIRLPLGRGLAGTVAETRATLNIPDVYNDSRFDSSSDQLTGFHTRNILAVPLFDRQSKLVGVLQVINKDQAEGPFSGDDEELLLALGSSAAIALQNARLLEEVGEKERMQRDLEIASEIQRSLLPQDMPVIPNLEIQAICRPSKEMSGDYFNVLDFGGRVGLVVADVCGKSVPAAFLMALAHNTVRMVMHKGASPKEVLRQANRWLYNQMGDRFIAVTYVLVDVAKRHVYFSNAGQPTYPIIVRQGRCYNIELAGLPLGIVEDVEYQQIMRTLRPDDLVLIYTDGVAEAMSVDKELFGFARLNAVAASCSGLSPKEAIERIVAAVDAFAAGADQADDITIMAFRLGEGAL